MENTKITQHTRYSFVVTFNSTAYQDRAFAIILSPEDYENAVQVDSPKGRAYWRATQYATSLCPPDGEVRIESVTLKEMNPS